MDDFLLDIVVGQAGIDYNGHLNDAEYARIFSQAIEALQARIGLDADGREHSGITVYTLETHLCYLAEVRNGQPLRLTFDVLDVDTKRLHLFLKMRAEDNALVATSEQMLMAMRADDASVGAWPEFARQYLTDFGVLARADWPAQAGRQIGLR